MKPLKKNEKKRSGGTPSFEERIIIRAQENEDREENFGKFLANIDKLPFQIIVSKWEKGAGPEYEERFAIRVIKDVGFFPLCWDLDKHLYPLLQEHPELVNELQLGLANKYTILPPEEKPKEGETEAEKQAREKERQKLKKTRRDPKEGVNSLIDAAFNGWESAIQGLLNAGVHVNAADNEGWTPLHWAAFKGHKACVDRLLKAPGVQVNAATKNGWTPLHWAADKGHEACVARLLDAPEVNVNAKGEYGWTPLHSAAEKGHVACVARLLDAPGVNVNAKGEYGWTPLHWAAFKGHKACVDLLLKAPGVQVNAKNNEGKTPIDVAKKTEIKEMFEKPEKGKKTSSSSSGGKPKTKPNVSKDYVTYTGKKYMVRVGSKGGKYILVGAEKRKVYVK